MYTTLNKDQKKIYLELEEGYKNRSHCWLKPSIGDRFPDDKTVEILSLVKTIPHKTILDVGSGSGSLTRHLSKLGKVIGIDVSASALKMARRDNPRISFYNCSVVDLRSDYRHFDLIVASEVLNYIKDKDKAICKMRSLGNYLVTSNFLLDTTCISLSGFITEIELARKLRAITRTAFVKEMGISIITLWRL